ncbi:hypothetical protein KP509_16G071200 [Ceratopteris richardii]|uniref:Uncharacterized protein n=1 Tax=Ceratopteris richardii TaxID=49495 RepID=A0A8T2SZT1_CERRI|nr:hypothetical protein KP509_16G071200 [Ceratopteris richardii]
MPLRRRNCPLAVRGPPHFTRLALTSCCSPCAMYYGSDTLSSLVGQPSVFRCAPRCPSLRRCHRLLHLGRLELGSAPCPSYPLPEELNDFQLYVDPSFPVWSFTVRIQVILALSHDLFLRAELFSRWNDAVCLHSTGQCALGWRICRPCSRSEGPVVAQFPFGSFSPRYHLISLLECHSWSCAWFTVVREADFVHLLSPLSLLVCWASPSADFGFICWCTVLFCAGMEALFISLA